MKGNKDVSIGWIKKAESDITNLTTMMESGKSLDTICFHAQQAAEKYLKAFLCFNGVLFPKTHDIEELLDLCATIDNRFSDLVEETIFLTDYAVELRYDFEFWPEEEDVSAAFEATNKIKQLVLSILPEGICSK
ncbi:MAG: HEPN domain-containing protein [bacterium]|nr:HEPN domain-containing protein [bacterium]